MWPMHWSVPSTWSRHENGVTKVRVGPIRHDNNDNNDDARVTRLAGLLAKTEQPKNWTVRFCPFCLFILACAKHQNMKTPKTLSWTVWRIIGGPRGPRGPWGPWGPWGLEPPPLPPRVFSKSCSFQTILRKSPLFCAKFELKTPLAPLTKILDPPEDVHAHTQLNSKRGYQ